MILGVFYPTSAAAQLVNNANALVLVRALNSVLPVIVPEFRLETDGMKAHAMTCNELDVRGWPVIDRRTFNFGLAGAAAGAASGFGPLTNAAFAQATMADRWQEYRAIVGQASRLGLAAPRVGVGLRGIGVDDALPIFSDLVETLERSAEAENIALTRAMT